MTSRRIIPLSEARALADLANQKNVQVEVEVAGRILRISPDRGVQPDTITLDGWRSRK